MISLKRIKIVLRNIIMVNIRAVLRLKGLLLLRRSLLLLLLKVYVVLLAG